jgi:hypothetical protein
MFPKLRAKAAIYQMGEVPFGGVETRLTLLLGVSVEGSWAELIFYLTHPFLLKKLNT